MAGIEIGVDVSCCPRRTEEMQANIFRSSRELVTQVPIEGHKIMDIPKWLFHRHFFTFPISLGKDDDNSR